MQVSLKGCRLLTAAHNALSPVNPMACSLRFVNGISEDCSNSYNSQSIGRAPTTSRLIFLARSSCRDTGTCFDVQHVRHYGTEAIFLSSRQSKQPTILHVNMSTCL
jgi:hypothetical protein